MDDDDDFGESMDDRFMAEANLRKVADKLGKDGFRIGKAIEEERQMQIGFDEGFESGIHLGKICGNLYGKACVVVEGSSAPEQRALLTALQHLLFEIVPENEEVDSESLLSIESILQQLSPQLMVDFLEFQSALLVS